MARGACGEARLEWPAPQGFPSGQRGRAVNPLAQPSEVRILLPAFSREGTSGSPHMPPPFELAFPSRGSDLSPGEARLRPSSRATLQRLALLAQSVEHLHGKEGVDGSSPSEGFGNLACRSYFKETRTRGASTEAPIGNELEISRCVPLASCAAHHGEGSGTHSRQRYPSIETCQHSPPQAIRTYCSNL
jgi:hypothetical protein